MYSTDPKPVEASPVGPSPVAMEQKPYVRLEKKGRGGKAVTVVRRLPAHPGWLKELSSHLKRAVGVGGTFYIDDGEGVVEVQGDHQAKVKSLLESYGKR